MDTIDKLTRIQKFMHYEITEESRGAPCAAPNTEPEGIPRQGVQLRNQVFPRQDLVGTFPVHMAALPNGQRMPLLKTALTTGCERNCNYCAFRAGRDFRRETSRPEELAKVFMDLFQAKMVQGLFLSSGIAGGGIRTQDRLLATAEILRIKYAFKGYIHLKIMPGSEKAQIEHGMRLADRLSVNLEAPTTERLAKLAPDKAFLDELVQPLRWIDEIRKNHPSHLGWKSRWPSSTTQYVVGAVNESDLELLQTTSYLHNELNISRAYFSGFNPIIDTPFENQPAVNPWREVRLYQASYLIRDYGYDFEDLIFDPGGSLPLYKDPKLLWAEKNISENPLEINTINQHLLLRIPGIGVKGARKIIARRHQSPVRRIEELQLIGINTKRAAPFILLNGIRPPLQLSLL